MEETYFEVLKLGREDLESIGFSAKDLTDSQMQSIADRLGEGLSESGAFWDGLEAIANDEKVPSNKNGQQKDA